MKSFKRHQENFCRLGWSKNGSQPDDAAHRYGHGNDSRESGTATRACGKQLLERRESWWLVPLEDRRVLSLAMIYELRGLIGSERLPTTAKYPVKQRL